MVDSSQTRLAYIAESAWGTTPATPTFQELRYTGENLNPNIENVVSNEIRSDRNVTDLIQVGAGAGGSIDFELTYGTLDDLLESLMYSAWATNTLKNGVTEQSLTFEKTFEAGATDQYHRITGGIVNNMSLAIAAGQIVTGSMDIIGKDYNTAQAAIAGSSYTGANSNDVMSAGNDFASLAITGVTGPEITALNLNIANNLRRQDVVGSIDARGIGTGRFEVSGDMTLYYENEELLDLFLAGTAADLSFILGTGSTYQFDIANLKFETAQVVAAGNDQDVFIETTFRGLYDGTDNTLEINRTP